MGRHEIAHFHLYVSRFNRYPTPKNLNYMWNFVAAWNNFSDHDCDGHLLSFNYTAHVDLAFDSVERIMRDVNHGWLIRYLHMNGPMFFLYLYPYFPRTLLWLIQSAARTSDN